MIKLSKMTDYGVVCLGMLARKPGTSMSATELSKETGFHNSSADGGESLKLAHNCDNYFSFFV